MLNPKYRHYANRLSELIEEGQNVARLQTPTHGGRAFIQGTNKVALHAWLAKTSNIIEVVFGSEGPHYRQFEQLVRKDIRLVERAHQIRPIIGLLTGALDDLEKGYLLGQEFLIAGDVFDSILEQAKHLTKTGHEDPAAVLARVVLEDSLKRLARSEGIDDSQKASVINDELRKAGRYAKPQWRLIQAWLDIGNAAAHGKFSEYTKEDVEKLIEDIERFLAAEFRA